MDAEAGAGGRGEIQVCVTGVVLGCGSDFAKLAIVHVGVISWHRPVGSITRRARFEDDYLEKATSVLEGAYPLPPIRVLPPTHERAIVIGGLDVGG